MHFEAPPPRTDEERILPLVNVVFLLLIFVMLAGQITATDPFQTAPPYSISENPAGRPETVLFLGVDGQMALDGTTIPENTLPALLIEKGDLGAVRLKADGRVSAVRLVSALEWLAAAGVGTVDLLTLPGSP